MDLRLRLLLTFTLMALYALAPPAKGQNRRKPAQADSRFAPPPVPPLDADFDYETDESMEMGDEGA
ncbi:MAG: hypothetical protein HC902_12890, partial [Calothrix sp. SM1_5_4]|nr:hypothetical protein [Calothrix sp. SM1_5_4]